MRAEVMYQFETNQVATRFLNRLKSGEVPGVKAKLQRGVAVLVSYPITVEVGFDTTISDLDSVANALGGCEVAI